MIFGAYKAYTTAEGSVYSLSSAGSIRLVTSELLRLIGMVFAYLTRPAFEPGTSLFNLPISLFCFIDIK